MPDQAGALTPADIDKLNHFLATTSPDEALTCPVTGERVPITEWNAPDRLVKLPSQDRDGPTYDALPLTSPAGGVLMLSALKIGFERSQDQEAHQDPPQA